MIRQCRMPPDDPYNHRKFHVPDEKTLSTNPSAAVQTLYRDRPASPATEPSRFSRPPSSQADLWQVQCHAAPPDHLPLLMVCPAVSDDAAAQYLRNNYSCLNEE